MRNKSSLMIIASMVLFLLSWSVGEASTWYVSKSGNDANTGNSLATAKLTIQAMINSGSVVTGDIIDIGAGTYIEQVVITSKSLTLRGHGASSTIIQAPTWGSMTIYNEAGLLFWNTANVANSLPTSQFRPIIYVDAASNSYTFNIYGIKIDGNSEAPATPTESFIGIMYRNAQGTVGNSVDTGKVQIVDIDGAGGTTDNTNFGFGIVCMGTANPLIQYTTFTGYHNVAIASIGRSLSSTLTSQMPNPVIADCIITGTTQNNTGWYSGTMNAFGGKITARRNFITAHRNTGGGFYASGMLIFDGRDALIGSNSVKSDGNNIIGNDWGLNVIVTNSIIGTPSLYTIKNNNIAYNGNTESGLTCTGTQATTGCVRYENTTSGADRVLALPSNAWGNADPLNNGYGISTGSPVAAGAATDAFWSVTSGDKMTVASPAFASTENVDISYTAATVGFGYSTFNTIQRAVNAAGNPSTVLVKDSTTYTENVCIFNKNNVTIVGDSTATCGSSSKPVINPSSGNGFHIYTLNAGATTTTNIIVNGFYFRQVGAQRVGILVTGYDAATNSAANKPPTGIQVRNTCFEGYATQAADGSTVAASAAMSSQEYSGGGTLNNTGRHSYGGNVAPAVADASDIDAQANNNFNYNGTSTSPSFKIWDKTDRNIADGANYYDARILQTNLIIVYCGDDLNTALAGLGAGPVTVYLQGDCIYKSASRLTISGVFDIGVDYTGRYQLPPLVVEPAGIVYANATAGLNWDDDCDVTGKPGVRFVTNATQLPLAASLINGHQPSGTSANSSATYMKSLTPVNYGAGGYDYKWTNYGTSRPSNIEVAGNNVGALLDAIDHIADTNGFAGTVTVQDAANFATGFDLHKRIRFATKTGAGNAQVTGTIRLWNKVLPFGPDCSTTAGVGALDDILDTRVTSGTFTAMNVQVGIAGSAAAIDRADNTDTTNTIQQGLVFTRTGGTCTVNNYGNYVSGTAQTATISRGNVTLTSDDANRFVQLEGGYITLNGSGAPGAGVQSTIVRFSVDTVKMALGTDAIQTALGVAGSQDDEGVGFDNQPNDNTLGGVASATQRKGTIVFNFAGASSSQTLIVEKDARFKGNSATPNTNSGSLTMRLGAQGTNIAGSTDFCNNTVNVTQVAGSGYTQIPDIQDGLLLACSGQTVNVGSPAAATTWGGGTDTYNRDNTISKPVLLQGTNTTNVCANTTNGGGFYIDAATAWTANASRSAFTSTFSAFTAANPIFKLDSAVNNVTIQGFDFTSIANGAAQAIVYSRKGNNTVTLTGNVVTNSSEQFVQADSLTTARTAWNLGCNRVTVTATAAPSFSILLDDINGLTMANNNLSYTAPTAGTEIVLLGGVSNLTFTDNVVEGSRNGGLFIHKSNTNAPAKNTPGGTNTILRNRFRANNSTNISNNGGLAFQNADAFTGTWTVSNNFINNNTYAGVEFSALGSNTPIPSINTFLVNDNSITGNTRGVEYLGLSTSGANANCGINARGNWWSNASGPTSIYNPLNITPCTATSYGDIVTQNAALTCPDSVTRVSFVPWWTLGTDANATLNGWQAPAAPANVLGRVVRTNNAGAYQASYATISLASAATSANDKVFVIQGLPSWTPAPGPDAASGPWGAYFSEAVPSPAVAGVEFRGVTASAYSCDSSKVKSASVYLAGTDNITNPIPSSFGAAITPNTAPISGQNVVGFTVTQNNTAIRNFNIQGYSSTAPTSTSGVGIRVSNASGATIEGNNFNGGQGSAGGTSATWGTFGIYLDRAVSTTVISNTFGDARDIGSIASGVGGVAIHSVDVTAGGAAIGPIAIGQTSPSSYLTASLGATVATAIGGRNTIRNAERAGIQIGGGGASNIAAAGSGDAGASTIINGNTIQGVRDARGGTALNALGGVFINASAGTVDVSNNRFGDTTVAGIGTRLLPGDNKIDIILGTNAFTFAAGSDSNIIRSTGQAVDASDVTVLDSAGTRGAGLRTFFNGATLNSFSHAAILTTDGAKPYDFTVTMNRNQPVVARGSAVGTTVTGEASTRIYRKIATPMSAIGAQTYAAGGTTFTNVVEIRENGAWALAGSSGSPTQYYAENLSLPSTTGIQNFLLLGPKGTNVLNNTSAHIISSTGPGTGTAITASGAENKYIRGGIVLHAVGSGLYGSIPAVATNKGDVYLQRAASGTDNGFVQFAYAATFGTQSLVTGINQETTGNNNNADKPSIIKAGLDDANDDSYTNTAAQNRRTGVFLAGNGTTFTKPTEPVTGLGNEGLVAYPNPANGGTVTVNFQVPNDTYVRIALYDALGRKVTDLNSGNVSAGVYNTSFDVSNLVSGAYTVRMEYDYFTKSVQVSVVK